MFNVCPACGMYSDAKDVLPVDGMHATAVCPTCGYAHPFVRLPLFIVTGASGTGKSTLALACAQNDRACIHLESDILWRVEFNRPDQDYYEYRNMWLRVAKNLSQAGRPVVLYGSAVPEQFEPCTERRYFSALHYLALVCDPADLTIRLSARPGWRLSASTAFVENMLQFNQWFLDNASLTQPPVSLLSTTGMSVDRSALAVLDWIRQRWKNNLEDENA